MLILYSGCHVPYHDATSLRQGRIRLGSEDPRLDHSGDAWYLACSYQASEIKQAAQFHVQA